MDRLGQGQGETLSLRVQEAKKYPDSDLLVYALIFHLYILDWLLVDSLVEYLVGKGFNVYLLDWGMPDNGKNLSFE